MFDRPSIRILTALVAATWWPGHVCCCQIAAADTTSPTPNIPLIAPAGHCLAETASADQASCCGKPAPESKPLAGSSTSASCDGCASDSGHQPLCGCIDIAAADAVPVGVAATSPWGTAAQQVDLLAELPAVDAAVVAARHPLRACRGSPRPAPAQTLLSLRCLLTT